MKFRTSIFHGIQIDMVVADRVRRNLTVGGGREAIWWRLIGRIYVTQYLGRRVTTADTATTAAVGTLTACSSDKKALSTMA